MRDSKRFWTSETQMYYNRKCIVHGEKCYLYDDEGNRYLDANSGTWNVFLGHGNKKIAVELENQLCELDYMSNHQFYHMQGDRLANRLIGLFPEEVFSSVYFTSGGAEAVESSIKLAKQYWYNKNEKGKHRMISLYESYHGSTIGAVSVSGDPWDRIPYDTIINDSIHFYPQYCYQCRLGLTPSNCGNACIKDLEYKINFYGAENISALIMEPVMGVGGVIIPSPDYLKHIVELCHKNNILVIFDEVTSGMGRCGSYFACMQYGVFPDMLLFGKAISNGAQPLAGVLVSSEIAKTFVNPKAEYQFRHGFTNSGHPLACVAGNCVLDIFEEEGVLKKCQEKSLIFENKLNRLKEYDFIGEIRIIGLMIAIELVNPVDKTSLIIPGLDIIFRKKGILLSQMTQVIGLMPPVVMSDEEFSYVLDTIVGTVRENINCRGGEKNV